MKRKTLNSIVRDEVLRESGYMCGNPGCRHILTLELHHIVWLKDGGGNESNNLIALCPYCHSLHTSGHIPSKAIQHWKGILVALNHAFNKESMDLLLLLHKINDSENIWFSADAMLKFASLIASDFVELADNKFSIGVSYPTATKTTPPSSPPTTSFRLKLTEKGRVFVKAWIEGDEEKYLKSIS